MAGMEAIRDAVKTTIEAAIPSLHCYDTVPDDPSVLPCVVVIPFIADFEVAMGRGLDTYEFDLIPLVTSAEMDIGQDSLDSYASGEGTKSIRKAIFSNRTLGLTDTDAHVAEMTEYGMRFPAAGFDHIGARLKLRVHTRGNTA